jgi:hypothetical protein
LLSACQSELDDFSINHDIHDATWISSQKDLCQTSSEGKMEILKMRIGAEAVTVMNATPEPWPTTTSKLQNKN